MESNVILIGSIPCKVPKHLRSTTAIVHIPAAPTPIVDSTAICNGDSQKSKAKKQVSRSTAWGDRVEHEEDNDLETFERDGENLEVKHEIVKQDRQGVPLEEEKIENDLVTPQVKETKEQREETFEEKTDTNFRHQQGVSRNEEIVAHDEDDGWKIHASKKSKLKKKKGIINIVEKKTREDGSKLKKEAILKERENVREYNDPEASIHDIENLEKKVEIVTQDEQGAPLQDDIVEHTKEYIEENLKEKTNIAIQHEEGMPLDDEIVKQEEDDGWTVHTSKKTKLKKKKGVVVEKRTSERNEEVAAKLREEALVKEKVKAKEAEERKRLYAKRVLERAEKMRKEEEERAKRANVEDENEEEMARREKEVATVKMVERCVLEEQKELEKRKIRNAKKDRKRVDKLQKEEMERKENEKKHAKKKAKKNATFEAILPPASITQEEEGMPNKSMPTPPSEPVTEVHLALPNQKKRRMQPCISVAVTALLVLSGVVSIMFI